MTSLAEMDGPENQIPPANYEKELRKELIRLQQCCRVSLGGEFGKCHLEIIRCLASIGNIVFDTTLEYEKSQAVLRAFVASARFKELLAKGVSREALSLGIRAYEQKAVHYIPEKKVKLHLNITRQQIRDAIAFLIEGIEQKASAEVERSRGSTISDERSYETPKKSRQQVTEKRVSFQISPALFDAVIGKPILEALDQNLKSIRGHEPFKHEVRQATTEYVNKLKGLVTNGKTAERGALRDARYAYEERCKTILKQHPELDGGFMKIVRRVARAGLLAINRLVRGNLAHTAEKIGHTRNYQQAQTVFARMSSTNIERFLFLKKKADGTSSSVIIS